MENNHIDGAHASDQVHTGLDGFGQWLTVQEAVAYCLLKGLSRKRSDDVDLSAPVASGAHELAPVPVDEQKRKHYCRGRAH
jgi:hypothetical protein